HLQVRALKQHLERFCGFPRFRQRLVHEDGTLLDDQDMLRPSEVQLVLLSFCLTSASRAAELVEAARTGMTATVEQLLHRPQDPNLGNPAPLLFAADNGHIEAARLLLEASADANISENTVFNDATPLILACQNGHFQVARLLLRAKADVDKADLDDVTPLHLACHYGHLQVAQLLLEAKAVVDKSSQPDSATPLMLACRR
ncbi:ANK3, partial [Symbiodinium sp. CCMP2456]